MITWERLRKKGLQFPLNYVICRIWKEKKNFKSAGDFKQALKNIKLEEERRIFYVACSRAKKILVLSYSEYEDNIAAGSENIKAKEIAPFFDDIVDKDNRLRIINQEGLDFIRLNYEKELYSGYEGYKDVFGFLKPVKKRKKDILNIMKKNFVLKGKTGRYFHILYISICR